MLEILRLIRLRTLAFAAFTLYAMRYFVIRPILGVNGFELQTQNWEFSLLVIAICCLIAGAYVINDYFDAKADRISGVKEIVVGKSISRRVAISLHSILNVLAVGIAFLLGYIVGVWKIGILFLLVSGILWFYSSTYQKYFILGNLLVGILAALIPVSVLLYEIPLLNAAYAPLLLETGTNFMFMFEWVCGFSWFIFLNILMYEINKDIYSVEGDTEDGVITIPVRLGVTIAKKVILVLGVIALLSLGLLYYGVFTDSLVILVYFIAALGIPYSIYLVSVAGKQGHRRFQLRLIRLIMVLCVGVSLLFKHFFLLLFAD